MNYRLCACGRRHHRDAKVCIDCASREAEALRPNFADIGEIDPRGKGVKNHSEYRTKYKERESE